MRHEDADNARLQLIMMQLSNAAEWNDRRAESLMWKLEKIASNHRLVMTDRGQSIIKTLQKEISRLQCQGLALWRAANSLRVSFA
jgi:hypothetical protein